MLLSREYLISSIRTIQPTYDSLSCVIEYILLFINSLDCITDIIIKEAKNSNACTNLFILYLLNELLVKLNATEESRKAHASNIKTVKNTLKEILKIGQKKIDIIKANSTEALKNTAVTLSKKFKEIEELIHSKQESTKAGKAESKEKKKRETTKTAEKVEEKKEEIDETYLDIEYLESLCRKKDVKGVIKYIKELKKTM
ncbi:hypothetical protein NERG_01938 [Nematocida ausubeli]|uniref:CID domain-containing protein n=1 Tax=Nematocida ausubeli (strain ATCC PRA-371 / ERTm2) TaxID=1913371 RepID=H8ZEB7_NEMA1|nr:hypothetical protein NERG_01938 [Nematocida ausubeli]